MTTTATEAQSLPRPPIHRQPLVAYFSMEIALQSEVPTYSGGLGVLAGDTIRSAADLQIPMVAVTLLHRQGYFTQRLGGDGWQTEESSPWVAEKYAEEMLPRVTVRLEDRTVHLRAWKYKVFGPEDFYVPVYLLDANLPENSPGDRALTDRLYGGDQYYRLCQEVILGIGGVRMLRALGYREIGRFHMNEGHASLLTLALLDEHAQQAGRQSFTRDDVDDVRKKCVFTSHTPVPAGHDQFPMDMVTGVLGRSEIEAMKDVFSCDGGLNLTYLALNLSHYVNGVAKKHGEVSRLMFAGYTVDAITNGVHAGTWVAPPFQKLYDRHIAGWREDNFSLRSALGIPQPDIWDAHQQAKQSLLEHVNRITGAGFDPNVLTIGFARRAATYKRADLIFHDLGRLKALVARTGPLQLVYAGKAHPQDQPGKEVIKRVFQARDALRDAIKIAYVPNYDMALAQLLTAGVDLWLNTPQPPLEASGTSGMKAALNGVPSLSVLDGWWVEGCIEGRTGWAIGERCDPQLTGADRAAGDAISLYEKLEHIVIPQFYRERDRFVDVMRHAIALNGSFFNTQRMVLQYVLKAYFR